MPSWWGWPTKNTRDRATSYLPALLYERLDEIGIDFTILYPSMTLSYLETPTTSSSACGAGPRTAPSPTCSRRIADRTTVGALVPMLDPKLAIDELEYAVRELGFKTVVFAGHARRSIGAGGNDDAYRLDTFGIDSALRLRPALGKVR